VPLPQVEDQALQNALVDLQNYQPSTQCQQNVVTRLQGFVLQDFKNYLSKGADFFDGTKSTIAANSIYPPVAAASWARQNPSVTSMASWFARSPGTNATTSLVAPRLTVYVRPNAVDPSNGGVNQRNRGFLFHEALHGFGQGNRYLDHDLTSAFNVSGASAGVSNHISQTCR
jgi:hypothetical protein